jgi:hypothetical protein
MSTSYQYTLAQFTSITAGQLDYTEFAYVLSQTFSTNSSYVTSDNNIITITFQTALTSGQITTLNNLVANYTNIYKDAYPAPRIGINGDLSGEYITFIKAPDTVVSATAPNTLQNKTITGTTNIVDANNLRNGSTWMTPLSGNAPTTGQVLTYRGTTAAWESANSPPYLTISPSTYTIGTASQSGTTVTGTGTTFTSLMVGGIIVFSGGQEAFITIFNSSTSLTVAQSQTVSATTYIIYYGGLQSDNSGNTSINTLHNTLLLTTTVYFVDTTDKTKRINFNASLNTTGTTLTLTSATTSNKIISFPDATDTVIVAAMSQTLSNKTLTSPIIATIINGGTLTLPSTTDVIVARNTTDILTNKLLSNASNYFVDATDNTKRIGFQSSGATTNTTMSLVGVQTANRSIQFPDISDTVVTLSATQSLSNKTLVAPIIATIVNGAQVLTLPSGTTDNLVARATTDTLSNKTLSAPIIATIVNGGAVLTLPSGVTDVIVARTTTDTLSNKTLTAPIIATIVNGGSTLTLPSGITDTLIGRTTTDVLSNKSLSNATVYNVDNTDNTKRIGYQTSGATTGTTMTLISAQTVNRSISFPDTSDTVGVLAGVQSFTNKTITGTTNMIDANNLRNGSTWVVSLSGSAPINGQILSYNGTSAIWQSGLTNLYYIASPSTYNTGTASQSTTTVTGNGTTFTNLMVGGIIVYGTGQEAFITAFNSSTSLTVSQSQTVASSTFVIYYGGFQTDNSGNTSINNLYNAQLLDNTTNIANNTDKTKKINFSAGANTTGTTLTLSSAVTSNKTISFPDVTDTVVLLAATQTLSNKTLTSPIISQIVNTGTLSLPSTSDTLIGRNTTDLLSNKSLNNGTVFFVDAVDNTKKIAHQTSGATTGTTLTLNSAQTANRTILFPDISDTVVTLTATQTLSSKTLTAPIISTIVNTGTLTLPTTTDVIVGRSTVDTLSNKTLTAPVISTIVNGGSTLTLPSGVADTLVARNTTDILNNKSLVNATNAFVDGTDNTKKINFQSNGASTTTSTTLVFSQTVNRNISFPDVTDTVVTLGATQTLSAKTLTTPIIAQISNAGILTLPSGITDNLVARTSTDTLSNKTLTAPIIATIVNGGSILTLPSGITDTLIGRTTTDILTNKLLVNASVYIVDGTDNTKRIGYQTSGATTGTTLTLIASHTANRSISYPDTSDTFAVLATAQSFTNKTITGTTNNVDANSLRNGATWVVPMGGVAPSTNQFLSYNGTSAVWSTSLAVMYYNTSPFTYNTGTASQSGNTITGSGTTFTAQMVGGIIVFNGGQEAFITAFTNSTTLTASQSQTVPSSTFILYYGGFQSDSSGNTATNNLYNAQLLDASINIVNNTDKTKKIGFSLGGSTTATTTTFVISQSANRSLTFPDATDIIVARNTTDTLSNKTLTAPVISTIVNGGTLTLPSGTTDVIVARNTIDTLTNKTLTAPIISTIINGGSTLTLPSGTTDTLVARGTTDIFTNKSLNNTSVFHTDNTDQTKRVGYQTSGAITATTTTLIFSQTANRNISFPDVTDVVVTLGATQTLSAKTLTAPIISTIVNTGTLTLPSTTDVLVGRATTDILTNKTLNSPIISTIINTGTLTLPTTTDTLIGRATIDTLTNKSLVNASNFFVDGTDATKRYGFTNSTSATGTTLTFSNTITANRTITFPDTTDTVVTLAATQTLSAKTLTAPVIATIVNGGTLTVPSSTDVLVARNTTDTLTNKTLTAPIIATIVNGGGTLTLPSGTTDTLVGRATTDIFSNKNLNNTNVFFVDNTDNTKRIGFQSSGATTGTTMTFVSNHTTNRNISFPDVTDTVVTLGATQTLVSKTLTAPVISTIINTGTLSLPTLTTTLVGTNTTDNLTNKSLINAGVFFVDGTDNTKKTGFVSSGATTGTTLTLSNSNTVNRTISFPDISDTIVTLSAVQTLVNKSFGVLTLTGNASAPQWLTNGLQFRTNPAIFTDTTSTGTVATNMVVSYSQPTLAATNTGVTYTISSSFYIAGPPIAGTNVTLTTPYAFYVASGNAYYGGGVTYNGDITFTTATTRKITSGGPEVVIEQTGDQFGASRLRLQNRNGANGVVFESATNDLVDFIMLPTVSGASQNIRYEHRATSIFGTGNTAGEFEFGPPAAPSLIIGAVTCGVLGTTKFGIGTANATAKLHITGNTSATAWGINGIQTRHDAGVFTDTSSTGTVAINSVNGFGVSTLAANSATTYTSAASIYIDGPPAAGTNVTITNPYSLYINSGNSYVGGFFGVGTIPTAQYTLGGGYTGPQWAQAGIQSRFLAATYTDTTSSGTIALTSINQVGIPTISASNATTYSIAATYRIGGAPIAGTNVTITTPYTLMITTGTSSFGGNVELLHIVGNSAVPTATPGTGLGGTRTSTLNTNSNDIAGLVNATSTATGTANAVISTVTFTTPYSTAPFVVIFPANAATARIALASTPFATATVNSFVITANSTALATGTYAWNYHVIE